MWAVRIVPVGVAVRVHLVIQPQGNVAVWWVWQEEIVLPVKMDFTISLKDLDVQVRATP